MVTLRELQEELRERNRRIFKAIQALSWTLDNFDCVDVRVRIRKVLDILGGFE